MNNIKIIGYVSETNPFEDRNAWSGLIYKVREAIENAGFEVLWIPFNNNTKFARFSAEFRWKLYGLCGNKQILGGTHFIPEVLAYAKSIKKDEQFRKCDAFFFPRGGQIGIFMKTKKPIIYYSDATAHVMVNYYWKNCLPFSVKMACYLERKASQRAELNIRSSQWAINSVIKDCNCNPLCCHVLEFGANIDSRDIKPITPYRDGILHVLFSGVEWERKGGDIAVETVKLLREKGIDAILHIVGIRELPFHCKELNYVVHHGFLNKNDMSSYQKYINIFMNSHIMLLPTQAECSATVYCEAAAFGLPTYTYATGGTENYVINGVNGYALHLSQHAEDFSNQIENDIRHKRILELHQGALRLYSERLSWSAWSKNFRIIMDRQFG